MAKKKIKVKKCEHSEDRYCIRNTKYCCPIGECLGITNEIIESQLQDIRYGYDTYKNER